MTPEDHPGLLLLLAAGMVTVTLAGMVLASIVLT